MLSAADAFLNCTTIVVYNRSNGATLRRSHSNKNEIHMRKKNRHPCKYQSYLIDYITNATKVTRFHFDHANLHHSEYVNARIFMGQNVLNHTEVTHEKKLLINYVKMFIFLIMVFSSELVCGLSAISSGQETNVVWPLRWACEGKNFFLHQCMKSPLRTTLMPRSSLNKYTYLRKNIYCFCEEVGSMKKAMRLGPFYTAVCTNEHIIG